VGDLDTVQARAADNVLFARVAPADQGAFRPEVEVDAGRALRGRAGGRCAQKVVLHDVVVRARAVAVKPLLLVAHDVPVREEGVPMMLSCAPLFR